jgi:hypothetical protein
MKRDHALDSLWLEQPIGDIAAQGTRGCERIEDDTCG